MEIPESISAPLGSGTVEFNCSALADVSLAFLVNGQSVSSLPDSRGITTQLSISMGPEGTLVSRVLTVPVIEENNNTEVVCFLISEELLQYSTSPPAVLAITDRKLNTYTCSITYQCSGPRSILTHGGECLDDSLCCIHKNSDCSIRLSMHTN